MRHSTIGAAMALALSASALPAQVAPPQSPSPAPTPNSPPAPDLPLGSGPYPAIMEEDPSLPGHTVYHPRDLAAVGKLPVLVWGNGGCANAGNSARPFLTEIASYGYIVVAAGVIDPKQGWTVLPPVPGAVPPGGPRPPARGTPGGPPRVLPPPATQTPSLIQAMDWVDRQAAAPDGPLAGKVDAARIAVAGHSCGGVQAIEASADRRVKTTIVMNSGLIAAGTAMAGGKQMTKDDLKKYHAPVAYLTGDGSDIAFANAADDFRQIGHVPVFRGYERGISHGGTFRLPNGGEYAGVVIAWLDWRLKQSAAAGKLFSGAACGLCVSPRWVVEKKGM